MTKKTGWADWTPDKNLELIPATPDGSRTAERTAAKPAKPFDYFQQLTVDKASVDAGLPDCAQVRPVPELSAIEGHFVPVSFVAKDWSVTPRRIRALLTAGRLAGRVQPNGYWEVRSPYLFALGTRGPSLKRQKRPSKRPRLVVDNSVGNQV